MKKLRKDQRGFTLVELLIAILLTGIVASAITGTILYVFNVNFSTANRMAAVRQVRNVGFWVTPDFQTARAVDPENNPATPELLTLNWMEWDTGYLHKIIYSLEDMSSGEFKVLKREHYIRYDTDFELDSTTIVAEYIDPGQTSIDPDQPCSFPNCDSYILTVTATVGGQSETRVYKVEPRPGSQ